MHSRDTNKDLRDKCCCHCIDHPYDKHAFTHFGCDPAYQSHDDRTNDVKNDPSNKGLRHLFRRTCIDMTSFFIFFAKQFIFLFDGKL